MTIESRACSIACNSSDKALKLNNLARYCLSLLLNYSLGRPNTLALEKRWSNIISVLYHKLSHYRRSMSRKAHGKYLKYEFAFTYSPACGCHKV